MRGPLALNRLSQGPKDTLLYRLKTPKPDGTTHLVFTPMTLLERLARLVPLPDKHLVRYHGVLAPAAAWRAQVVPAKPVEGTVLPRTGGRRIVWAGEPLRAGSQWPAPGCEGFSHWKFSPVPAVEHAG